MGKTDVNAIQGEGEVVCEKRYELEERILIDHVRRLCAVSTLRSVCQDLLTALVRYGDERELPLDFCLAI